MHGIRAVGIAAAILWSAGHAAAQEARPPIEVGVGVSRLITVPYEDFFTSDFVAPALDVRATVPLTPRFSFEAIGTIGRESTARFTRVDGLYLLQVKQRLRSATRGRFHGFLTYGAAGYYNHVRQDGVRYTSWDEPYAAVAGGGVQYALADRVAVRAEAQMLAFVYIPIGARIAGSVSIPFGRYR